MNLLRRFRDRLNHACFIIDRLQGQHRPETRHTGQLFAQIVEVEPALRVERDLRDPVRRKAMPGKNARMFAGADQQELALGRLQGHVRGLGGAGDENHPVGFGSQCGRQRAARQFDERPGGAAFRMDAGGVARLQSLQKRLPRFRSQRRRSVMIEIDATHPSTPSPQPSRDA